MDVTIDTLEARLNEAAENLPGPYRPEEHSWGQGFAHQVLSEGDDEIKAKLGEVFDRFLREGNTDQARLAATTYPELVGATRGILHALGRDDLPEDDRLALLSALGRAVESGQIEYSPDFREYIVVNQTRPLLSGAVLCDHTWFLENLVSILTKKPGDAATAIWFAAQPLRKNELLKLRDELNEHGEGLGKKTLARVVKVLDDELKEAGEDAEAARF